MDDWRDQANCRGVNPNVFFPRRGTKNQHHLIGQAVAICDHCEVEDICLETHLKEPWGIWGGKPERARRQMRKDRRLSDPLRASRRAS